MKTWMPPWWLQMRIDCCSCTQESGCLGLRPLRSTVNLLPSRCRRARWTHLHDLAWHCLMLRGAVYAVKQMELYCRRWQPLVETAAAAVGKWGSFFLIGFTLFPGQLINAVHCVRLVACSLSMFKLHWRCFLSIKGHCLNGNSVSESTRWVREVFSFLFQVIQPPLEYWTYISCTVTEVSIANEN